MPEPEPSKSEFSKEATDAIVKMADAITKLGERLTGIEKALTAKEGAGETTTLPKSETEAQTGKPVDDKVKVVDKTHAEEDEEEDGKLKEAGEKEEEEKPKEKEAGLKKGSDVKQAVAEVLKEMGFKTGGMTPRPDHVEVQKQAPAEKDESFELVQKARKGPVDLGAFNKQAHENERKRTQEAINSFLGY